MSLRALTAPGNSTLPNTAAVLSTLGIFGGLYTFISPFEALSQFGLSLPVRKDRTSLELASALTRVYGVRDLSMSVINIALWFNYRGAAGAGKLAWRQALGLSFVLNIVTPLIDGIVCETERGSTGWRHWLFVPITATLGAGLLVQA